MDIIYYSMRAREDISYRQIVYPTAIISEIQQDSLVVIDCAEQVLRVVSDIRRAFLAVPIVVVSDAVSVSALVLLRLAAQVDIVERAFIVKYLATKQVKNTEQLPFAALGFSAHAEHIRADLQVLLRVTMPVLMCGPQGIGKRALVHYLHRNGLYSDRGMAEISLAQYSGESAETHIWTALRDVFKGQPTAVSGYMVPQYGALYIKGLEQLDILFLISLLEWLYEQVAQPSYAYGFPLRVFICIEDEALIKKIPHEFYEKYMACFLPGLAERREDVVALVHYFFDAFAMTYQRPMVAVSPEAMHWLVSRNWSGNIEELRYNLETAFLALSPEKQYVSLADLVMTEQERTAFLFSGKQSPLLM